MRPITVVVIVGVVIAAGLLMSPMLAEGTVSVSFDANKVPIGFMDIDPLEKEVSDSLNDKALQNPILI